jgi:hypothetical protein
VLTYEQPMAQAEVEANGEMREGSSYRKSDFCKASSKTLQTQILIPGLWMAFSALSLKRRSRTSKL